MSESELKLAKAPVVEAVIDIDCDMPPGFDLAALEGPARKVFLAHYPKFRSQFLEQHRIESKLDEPAKHSAKRALPAGIQLPEFAPEPDGSVSLDWIESRIRMFSVSVGTGSRLAYAWLDDSDRGHGVAQFDGERIPARVLEGIRGIISHGNIAVRPF